MTDSAQPPIPATGDAAGAAGGAGSEHINLKVKA